MATHQVLASNGDGDTNPDGDNVLLFRQTEAAAVHTALGQLPFYERVVITFPDGRTRTYTVTVEDAEAPST